MSCSDAPTTVVDSDTLYSAAVDRARLEATNKRQWAAIRAAKVRLGFALTCDPNMFHVHARAALMALRGIGDE